MNKKLRFLWDTSQNRAQLKNNMSVHPESSCIMNKSMWGFLEQASLLCSADRISLGKPETGHLGGH